MSKRKSPATTSIAQLRKVDWTRIEEDVVMRIRLLKAAVDKCDMGPWGDKIANELILPSMRHIAAFCECVTITEDVETEDAVSDA